MKNYAAFLFLWICLLSCSRKDNKVESTGATRLQLMQADQAFSKMSEARGMKQAFIDFIDSNGVLLRPNHMPIVGANAIDYLIQQNDTEYTLSWEPRYAEASSSGDLGFTYGIYQLHLKQKDTSLYGSYVSIWKKQKDGKWKFVLDCGNEGIGSE
ncbi:MAG: hypothetical protein ABIN36_18360 [Ferruginibacter sp.]